MLAHEISRRFLAEHPEDFDRYGQAGFDWCAHDNQWILTWAAHDAEPEFLQGQIGWLADLLHARDYPTERLARDLEIAATVVAESGVSAKAMAQRLASSAQWLRMRPAHPESEPRA